MSIRRRLVVAGLVGISVVGVAGVGAQAAHQPLEAHRLPGVAPCKVVKHGTTEAIVTTSNGEAPSTTNAPSTAVVKVGKEGVEATLPDAGAKALYLEEPVRTTKVARIGKLSYRTLQLNPGSVALWSYQLPIDINGGTLQAGDFTTLVYEPYQDGRSIVADRWQTWDALRGGQAKWWSTRALPLVANGATQAFPTAWAAILAAYPDATVLAYGMNLGKGSPGASARVDGLTFGAGDACVTHQWSTRFDRRSRHVSIFQLWRRWLLP
ncbi:hypothetical protein OHA72_11515 [Dactylosporangium sp. NBC_01737]|uniref:hypothetical protein n=1 Tax=Dactylosporangium sp. NBC_01737 TaxID=2975959 RepID=UPI002E0E8C7C|nr:hypothetical protein OHA72_11515 [Dactylosporangium sp. NBC_01737]